MNEEEQYAPIITHVVTEYGLMTIGIGFPENSYNAWVKEEPEIWQDFLELLDDQVNQNMSELSKGADSQD